MPDENMEQIKLQHQKKIQVEENAKKKEKMPKSKEPNNQTTCKSPMATTSGLQINRVNQHGKGAKPETDGDHKDQSDLCCVCGRSSPPQLKDIHTLVIIKWGQCEKCQHWVHLTYCCDVRVLRRDSTFLCIHCSAEE
ncbi:hypothetical protein DPMN_138603 [Dreissena polymorpha]|uniref:Uncharacterized protein n=1 Tax=Dreissena polymorpha TaxID=45954 RepID=A0A9D4JHF9_DREPO|nr:hypothetical protein DPMN_138603 [Dreissena polymorpha]